MLKGDKISLVFFHPRRQWTNGAENPIFVDNFDAFAHDVMLTNARTAVDIAPP